MESKDLSEAICKIQVAMRVLGLEWWSGRVQGWLNRAGEAYVERCHAEGLLCWSPPPYKRLANVPGPLVIALARRLWEAAEATPARGAVMPARMEMLLIRELGMPNFNQPGVLERALEWGEFCETDSQEATDDGCARV